MSKQKPDRADLGKEVRKLATGKYRDSIAPCKEIVRELSEKLVKSGIHKDDHLIAVMNMKVR